jgi:hypothetical protein
MALIFNTHRGLLAIVCITALINPGLSQLATCDFFLTLEGHYSSLDLAQYDIVTGKSLCAQGSASAAGRGVTMAEFIVSTDAQIEAASRSYFDGANLSNGFNTTDMIILDIELPVHQQDMVDLNATIFPLWVEGFKRRVDVARRLLPYATLGIYGVVVDDCRTNATCLARLVGAYQQAAKLGMYDAADVFCPRLYPTPTWTPAEAAAIAQVTFGCTAAIVRSDGTSVPVAPFLSYFTIPGNFPVAADVAHAQLSALQDVLRNPPPCPGVPTQRTQTELHSIHYWAGDDNATMAIPWFTSVQPAAPCMKTAATVQTGNKQLG